MDDLITLGHDAPTLSPDRAEQLVLSTVSTHGDALLRTARRYSLCHDDALDAYQRGLEIFMRRAPTLEPDRAHRWLHVVIRNEALAVRKDRGDVIASEDFDADRHAAGLTETPEERVIAQDRTTRAAEALQRLKPQELRAMWLKATGRSYQEICDETGWTFTKVNRCLTEGRKSFLARYAGIEAGAECERWQPVLSAIVDGEATAAQLAEARPHLRNCTACRATIRELHDASSRLSAMLPVFAITGAAADGDRADAGIGLLGRVWESVTTFLGERSAVAAVKAQAALDLAASGKAVAVVASAAAVAGGGAAAVHQADSTSHREPKVASVTTTPRTAPTPTSPLAAPATAAADPRPAALLASQAAGAARTAARRARAKAARERRAAAADEFSPTAPAPSSSSAASTSREAAAVAGEFVENQATSIAPITSVPPKPLGNGGEFDP